MYYRPLAYWGLSDNKIMQWCLHFVRGLNAMEYRHKNLWRHSTKPFQKWPLHNWSNSVGEGGGTIRPIRSTKFPTQTVIKVKQSRTSTSSLRVQAKTFAWLNRLFYYAIWYKDLSLFSLNQPFIPLSDVLLVLYYYVVCTSSNCTCSFAWCQLRPFLFNYILNASLQNDRIPTSIYK